MSGDVFFRGRSHDRSDSVIQQPVIGRKFLLDGYQRDRLLLSIAQVFQRTLHMLLPTMKRSQHEFLTVTADT
jgi:hypothetical protein